MSEMSEHRRSAGVDPSHLTSGSQHSFEWEYGPPGPDRIVCRCSECDPTRNAPPEPAPVDSYPTYHAIEEAKRHVMEDLYFPPPRPGELRFDLPPGSPEAVEAGCSCPRVDNAYGRGFRSFLGDPHADRFVISAGCSLHGWRLKGLEARA